MHIILNHTDAHKLCRYNDILGEKTLDKELKI